MSICRIIKWIRKSGKSSKERFGQLSLEAMVFLSVFFLFLVLALQHSLNLVKIANSMEGDFSCISKTAATNIWGITIPHSNYEYTSSLISLNNSYYIKCNSTRIGRYFGDTIIIG